MTFGREEILVVGERRGRPGYGRFAVGIALVPAHTIRLGHALTVPTEIDRRKVIGGQTSWTPTYATKKFGLDVCQFTCGKAASQGGPSPMTESGPGSTVY